jgi:hypothetical protein
LLLGAKLVVAAKSARRQVTLIAPFIKVEALRKVLTPVDAAANVCVIARWIPAEIAGGVCDLEIFDEISARPNAKLYVHPLLHAKLYRFDETILYGSANLTAKALGWRAPANIELLHSATELRDELLAFERDLLKASIEVDAAYRDSILAQVEKLGDVAVSFTEAFEAETRGVTQFWLPTSMNPEGLWGVYADPKDARRRIVESSFMAAEADLNALGIEPGLSQQQFNQHIIAVLQQMPLVQEIDAAASGGITSQQATQLIEERTQGQTLPYPPPVMWEVLQTWLMYFFPRRYRTEAAAEVFRRGRVLE